MKCTISAIALTLALALCALPASASASFGLKDMGLTFTTGPGNTPLAQAGAHPFEFDTDLSTNTHPEPALPEIGEVTDGAVKDLRISTPPGIAPNLTAVPRCSTVDFLSHNCAPSAQIGKATIILGDPHTTEAKPVYNLVPPPGGVLKLGFIVAVPVTVEVAVNPNPPYNGIAKVSEVANLVQFYASHVALWGVPASPAHDAERDGHKPAGVSEVPFFTVPRACEGALKATFQALSWEGESFEQSIATQAFGECSRLGFAPEPAVRPSTDQAESPSGLDFELNVDDEGFTNPSGLADSDIKKTTVILPEGVTLNPSVAEGLLTCTPAQYESESVSSEPGQGCPEASKVGTVEVETPVLGDQVLKGALFVAQQEQNPFHSLIALYMVIKDRELGILIKLAGKVSPNPTTGQIETTFGEPGQELPQYPLSRVAIHLREGGRSPLISPALCGTYTTQAIFTPWADPAHPLPTSSSFQITKGVAGGPCPTGPPPFNPGFSAGTVNNSAATYSPFDMRLSRRDGDQDLTKFSAVLPPGVIGKLAGVGKCTDAQIEAAKAKSGRAEMASPSCPTNSQIGRTVAGAGVGSQLTYVPGSLYLAGPYHGDPLSVVAITPAVAGPFDVGTVVVRVALTLNPKTAEVEADGSASDPIPHILAGIVLKVRDLRVYADRPQFTLNPTNCEPSRTRATLFGSYLKVFDPSDDIPVARSDRFQAANCASLGFKPKLSMQLSGGTRRGAHPSFKAVVTTRSGDANFAGAVVTLPRSAFLDQGHIRTICTRVQFAAGACPKAAIYGHAKVLTPLLDEPLQGPVYLRSSNHNLPDLVLDLHGIVDIEASARIDSHKGGIRTSFEAVPDARFSRFVLQLPGGKKGLIVNSRNLCARESRATVSLEGQNNKTDDFSPVLRAAGCSKG